MARREFHAAAKWAATVRQDPSISSKIESFARLAEGWHCGSGGPVAQATVAAALNLHAALFRAGLPRTDAFAGEGREILLTAYRGAPPNEEYFAAIVEPDGGFSLRHESGGKELDYIESRDIGEIERAIHRIAVGSCNTSDSSIRAISTRTQVVSTT